MVEQNSVGNANMKSEEVEHIYEQPEFPHRILQRGLWQRPLAMPGDARPRQGRLKWPENQV